MNTEEKVLQYLEIMSIKPDHNIELDELKKEYLRLAKVYHPDTCALEFKDGVMFSKMKEAYEYLKENINIVNNVIYNILNPNNKKYTYYNPNDYANNQYGNTYGGFSGYSGAYYYSTNSSNIVIKDRFSPSIFSSFLSLIMPFYGILSFALLRKTLKKNAVFYLTLSIISLTLSILPYLIY